MNIIKWVQDRYAAFHWYLLFKKFYKRLKRGDVAFIGIMLKGNKNRYFVDYGDSADFSILLLTINHRPDHHTRNNVTDITMINWRDIKFMWTADKAGAVDATALTCAENIGVGNNSMLNLHRRNNDQKAAA